MHVLNFQAKQKTPDEVNRYSLRCLHNYTRRHFLNSRQTPQNCFGDVTNGTPSLISICLIQPVVGRTGTTFSLTLLGITAELTFSKYDVKKN